MATHPPTPFPAVQIVVNPGKGKDKDFKAQDFKKMIDDHCIKKSDVHYTVVSIIGAQSSGKSTLMNFMFKTEFQMLDQRREGRRAKTEGIWAAVCKDHHVIVLDIEGADGEEHQDDSGFENQTALFALVISDVIFININFQDTGRMHAANIPLLRTIFQERLRHKMHMTKVVIAVRDYNNQIPESDLREQLLSTLDKVWASTNNEISTLREYFEPSVELFPHFEYNLIALQEKCQEIIDQPQFFNKRQNNWPVDEFPILAEKLWKSILQNEKLDMPAYWTMLSRERCEAVMKKKICSLESNQDYQILTKGDLNNPSSFHATLEQILEKTLHEYSDEVKYFHEEIANKVKGTLKTQILHDAEAAFVKAMENCKVALTERATTEIEEALTLNPFEDIDSIVLQHSTRFDNDTKDLSMYNDIVIAYQHETRQNLELLTRKIQDKAVLAVSRRDCMNIMSQLLSSLESDQGYLSLINGEMEHPRTFCNRLNRILIFVHSDYDDRARRYNRKDAQDVKEKLNTDILNNTKGAFIATMEKFVEGFLQRVAQVIKQALEGNLFEDMESTVMKHNVKFQNETHGLNPYDDIVKEHQLEVELNLKSLTRSIRDKAVLSFVGRYSALFLRIAGQLLLVAAYYRQQPPVN